MIRVNLLQPRAQQGHDPQSAVLPGGRSAFISGREILVAVILLVAGASMLHLHYGLSDAEQADGGNDAVAASPPQADSSNTALGGSNNAPDSSDLASSALPADSASADGNEETNGGPGQDSPFTVAADESSSTLATSPTPEQRAMAKARQDAAARPATKSRQPTTAPSPPPGTAKLSDLLITDRGGALRLSLITGERSAYNMFRLENPNRVVVDMPGTRITLPFDRLSQEISHPLVRRIRLGQYKSNPPISRLVLDVEGFPNLLVFPHSSGLDIQVSSTTE